MTIDELIEASREKTLSRLERGIFRAEDMTTAWLEEHRNTDSPNREAIRDELDRRYAAASPTLETLAWFFVAALRAAAPSADPARVRQAKGAALNAGYVPLGVGYESAGHQHRRATAEAFRRRPL